jgi:hypothetical protein
MPHEGTCTECGRAGPQDIHHIIFKGMGGSDCLDYPLNLMDLGSSFSCNCHEGPSGPHHNKKKDLQYRQELQAKLKTIINSDLYYTQTEIVNLVQIPKNQIKAVFKTLQQTEKGYLGKNIIKQLLGGRFYD